MRESMRPFRIRASTLRGQTTLPTNALQTTCFSNLCAQNLGPLWSHRERLGEILGYLPTLQLRGKLGMRGTPRQASTSNAQHLLMPDGCTGGWVRGWVDG